MACTGRILVWWDRDFDTSGRRIRSDARSAGRDLWERACQHTVTAIHDVGPAAELMENAVAQVSRYLDRIGAPMSSRKHGLVMVAFCRALRRYADKSRRLELLGGTNDLSGHTVDDHWLVRANARLELERIVRQLTHRNAEVLTLRAAGFEWEANCRNLRKLGCSRAQQLLARDRKNSMEFSGSARRQSSPGSHATAWLCSGFP
jgi:hypothetical protein